MKSGLTLALPKGRLLDPALELLRTLGVNGIDPESRKLIFRDTARDLEILLLKPADVPAYVTYGAADFGSRARSDGPKPQLAPSKIIALSGALDVSTRLRRASASNIRGPRLWRSLSRTFLDGLPNDCPYRTGILINPWSWAYFMTTRIRVISVPRATGPRVFARSARSRSRSRAASPSRARCPD